MDAHKFGAFVAKCRKERNMTQADLALKIQVTDKAVSRWERGIGFPDINTIEPLANALEVSVLELMKSERMAANQVERLHEAMEVAAQTAVDAEKWIGLMKQYVNPTELTSELLNTLIEKILVHEAVKSEDGSREQEVEIFYRFIGKIE